MNTSTVDDIVQDRGFMATHFVRGEGKNFRYAIKVLQESVRKDPQLYVRSVLDLVVEMRYLAVLRHPYIIKMRAMADTSPFDEGKTFFVVLDKLYDILYNRLRTNWKKRLPGPFSWLTDCAGRRAKQFWVERLSVAHDLSSALGYLHGERLMYRDLKPDNIGFDVRGDVKIFDFGLVHELHDSNRNDDGTYRLLTGDTGSPRYMAPEVALGKPYNEKCDVYSFCILMWEILRVEQPFDHYKTVDILQKKVVEQGVRPKPDPSWPPELVEVMKRGWNDDQHRRPSMVEFSHVLQSVIRDATGEQRELMMDISEKSLQGSSDF